MEGENVGKDSWNLGPLGEWRGNLVQCTPSGTYEGYTKEDL